MSNEIKRMRYFNGLLLKEEDLNLEQNYNMRLHRLHNRYFHDWGIMDGLEVEAVVGAPQVRISQGMALNRVLVEETKEEHSQEILICDNHPDNPVDLSAYNPGDNIYISVCYEEVPSDIDRQKGGHEIHVWERAAIKHSTTKPEDPRKDIILALVRLDADEAGNKTIREILDTDVDGETKLRTYAVLRGQALEVDKLSVGPKDKLYLPYISGLNDPEIGEGDGIDVHSPFTRFTGSVISGAIRTLGNVDVKGALTVMTNNSQALKVNATGNVDIMSATSIGGKLSVAGGLNVKGDNTTIDTAQVNVTNNMVTLNKYTPEEGVTEPKNQSSGIEVYRGGVAPNVRMVWDESEKVWKAGMDKRDDIPGSGMYAVAYGADWDKMHSGSNVDDLHKHSQFCSPDGNVVLSAVSSGDIDVHNSLVASGSVISKSGSFEVTRPGELKNAKLLWNEGDGRWQVDIEGNVYNILYGDEWNELTTGANVDSLHIHSQLFNADGSSMALRINSAGDVDVASDLSVGQNLTVAGNLNVLGTTTTVNTVKLEVTDNVVVVNKCEPGTQPVAEGGLEVYRGGTLPNARIIWDEGSNLWKIGIGSSMFEMPYGSQWDELTHGAVTEGLHKHGQLYAGDGSAALSIDESGNAEAQGDVFVYGGLTVENDAQINGLLAVNGSVEIEGDLTVSGTTTTVNARNLEVEDRVVVVNKYTGEDNPLEGQGGLEVYRGGVEPNARIVWEEAEGKWKAGLGDNIVGLAYGQEWENLISAINADNLHKHGQLCRLDGNTALSVTTEGKVEMYGDSEVRGMLSVGGSMTVTGDLIVKGTTVTQTDMQVTDSFIVLNKYIEGTPPVYESGIEIYRGETNSKARIVWDELLKKWRMGIGSELYEIAGGIAWSKLTKEDNADSLHMHSQVYNEKGDILALSASASGNVDVAHGMTVGQNLKVLGNLDITGGLTSINTPIFEVRSNTIVVNRYEPGTAPLGTNGGLMVYRGLDLPNAAVIWDEDNNRWKIGASTEGAGLIVNSNGSIIASGSMQASEANILGGLQAASANIQGSLTVKTGMEVSRGPEHKAYVMWDEVTDQWKIGTSSGAGISITANGNLGIGTEAPTAALDVNGDAVVGGNITAERAEVKGSLAVNGSLVLGNGLEVDRGVDSNGVALKKARVMWDANRNKWLFGTEDNMQEIMLNNHKHNNLYNWDGSITALSADPKGNIGIGTTTPTAKLDVSGDAVINGKLTTKTGLEISRGLDSKAKLYWNEISDKWQAGTEVDLKDISLSDHKHQNLYTLGGIAAVNVDTGGNVGIGKTAPTTKLDVAGTIQGTNANIVGTLESNSIIASTATVNGDLSTASVIASGNINAASATITKDLTVEGKLTVNGTMVTVNAETLEVEDNIVRVNKYLPQNEPANVNGGLEVFRGGTAKEAQIIWDEAADKWKAGTSDNLKELSYSDHKHENLFTADGTAVMNVNAAGNVGIGTAAPSAKLDVQGDAKVSGSINAAGASVTGSLSAGSADISGNINADSATVNGSISSASATVSGGLSALNADITDTLNAANAVISGNINTANATITNDLTVDGNLTVNGTTVTVNAATLEVEDSIVRVNKYAAQTEPASINGGLEVFRGGTAKEAQIIWDEAADKWKAGTSDNLKELSYSDHKHSNVCTPDGTSIMSISNVGNVGIGTAAPSAKLDVQGDVKVSGSINGASAAVTGSLSAASADISGALNTVSAIVDGNISAASATVNGSLSAVNADITGTLDAANAVVRGSLTVGSGMEVLRGTEAKAQLIWDEASDKWQAGILGSLKELSYSDHKHSNVCTPEGAVIMSVNDIGNVGIGTITPSSKLDVQGDAKVSGSINAVGASVTGSLSAGSANIIGALNAASANITNDLTVEGKLTVNGTTVTVDAATLEVEDNIVRVNKYAAQNEPANVNGGLEVFRGGTAKEAQIIWDETADKWKAGTSDNLKELSYSDHKHENLFTADGTAVMNVNVAGNVGIGTAAPSAKLDVQGDAKVSGSINAAGVSVTGSLSAGSADISGALNAASATVNGGLSALNADITDTLNAANAVISGNISAASATVNGGLNALNADITDTLNAVNAVISGNLTVGSGIEVLRGLDSKAQLIWDETTGKWQAGILGSLKELSYSDHKHENLYTADGVIAMNVDAVGNIGIGKIPDPSYKLDVDGALQVVTLAQTSSQSYKENIEQLKDKTALDLLAKLKPVSFDFKAHNTKKHNIGFIAEEVPDVFATSDHKAVSLMDIIGVLTTVVKMQQKETTSMKKQMKALEKQIASLVGA